MLNVLVFSGFSIKKIYVVDKKKKKKKKKKEKETAQ